MSRTHPFSPRVPPHGTINAITREIEILRMAGTAFADLTESNPTRVGLPYPPDLLKALAGAAAYRYDPEPLGLRSAREAVAADVSRRGPSIDPAHVVLSASSSESYSWLFTLLCDAGERVLVPRPGYPLFEQLTRLQSVHVSYYDLELHGRWSIDFASVEAAPPDTRAIIVVSPNNPTGSYLTGRDLSRLMAIARERGWALIADEVFADYTLDATEVTTDIAARADDVLSFTLGGASKSLGLPQVKLGWMIVGGPATARDAALGALEMIADTFLSVSTPVQVAAPSLFSRGAAVREAIQRRIRANLAQVRQLVDAHPACELLPAGGGWSAVLRVPATRSEEQLVVELLRHERVLVHPGYFFDFPCEAFLVVSLLPPEPLFRDAVARMLQFVEIHAGE